MFSVISPIKLGRKRLHDFAANLFRKLCINFIRIAQIGDIAETFWPLFLDTLYTVSQKKTKNMSVIEF